MIDNLRDEQVRLEAESRGETIRRFKAVHDKASIKGNYSDTNVGTFLLKSYIETFTKGILEFTECAVKGKAGRKNIASKLISQLEPEVVAFIFLKAIINKVPMYHLSKPCTTIGLAIAGAGMLHDELRIRYFEENWRHLAKKLFKDFAERELPRYKKRDMIKRQFHSLKLDWAVWSKDDMVHVGTKLAEIFKDTTGDIRLIDRKNNGRHTTSMVEALPSLVDFVTKRIDGTEALFTQYFPMVIPPVPWSNVTMEKGGYISHHVTSYCLVKTPSYLESSKEYRKALDADTMSETVAAINALQETPWRINEGVLEALMYVYDLKREIAGLPSCDDTPIPPMPVGLDPKDFDSELSKEYRKECFLIHEANRKNVSKRVATSRILGLARKFKVYEALYFPHDLDSRSRTYPKPALLNPQGPDYAKALLEFSEGKPIATEEDACWLAFHGANSWGFDKGTLQERVNWVTEHEEMILSCARDPKSDLRWTDCDNPAKFLAFCFEWADFDAYGYGVLTHIHVDVDATCSGLQIFSAMLRDKECGHSVNMTSDPVRQDIYQRSSDRATEKFQGETNSDFMGMSQAWLDFGMDRSITKRSVMIVPYAGTFHACMKYVEEEVEKKIKKGIPLPWHGKMKDFVIYGAKQLWPSIIETVPSATQAMHWLSAVSKAVAKSVDDERYVRWVTPTGFPVRQHKFKLGSKQIDTKLDGKLWKPRITIEKDELDSRQMASCIPPSFVHSLDACHMQKTIAKAHSEGMRHFAAVHDSFGVHCTDIPRFNAIIRESFVSIYEDHDVLQEFWESNASVIKPEYLDDITEKPPMGDLDIRGVLESDYFFS
tara:strand:- start:75 stop:2561 length:2487 start_codon:yes stop_codon:yes gene_type:complete